METVVAKKQVRIKEEPVSRKSNRSASGRPKSNIGNCKTSFIIILTTLILFTNESLFRMLFIGKNQTIKIKNSQGNELKNSIA